MPSIPLYFVEYVTECEMDHRVVAPRCFRSAFNTSPKNDSDHSTYADFVFFYSLCCSSGEFHLGYSRNELQGVSWYHLLHWDSTREAQSKHRLSKLRRIISKRIVSASANAKSALSDPPSDCWQLIRGPIDATETNRRRRRAIYRRRSHSL